MQPPHALFHVLLSVVACGGVKRGGFLAPRELAREFSPFSRSLLTFLAKQESKNPFGNLPKTKEFIPSTAGEK